MSPKKSLLLSAAAATLLLCVGCSMSPDVATIVTIADGTKVDVPLGANGNQPVSDDAVSIRLLQFSPWDMGPDKPKAVAFHFIVEFLKGAQPTSIKIEDVTEDPIELIYEDDHAHLTKGNIWGAGSRPFAPQDEHVKWILTLDNNVRVYKFTVKLADGTVHTLLKPIIIPGFMKDFMRTQLGLKAQ
jgi:hypothetical protein